MRMALARGLAGLLLLPGLAAAYPDPGDVPRYHPSDCFEAHGRRFVHDYLGLLDDVEGAFVEERACALYLQTSAHLVLVTVPDLGGETLELYAVHLVEAWGVGDDERLDGLLVLYAADDGTGAGTGALRVEVGYGLESTVVATLARDAHEAMAALKQRQIANGSTDADATATALAVGTAALAGVVADAYDGVPQRQPGPAPGRGADGLLGQPDWVWWLVGLAVLSALLGAGYGRRGGGPPPGGWGGPPQGGWGGPPRRGGGGGRFGGGRSGGGGWGGRLAPPGPASGPS